MRELFSAMLGSGTSLAAVSSLLVVTICNGTAGWRPRSTTKQFDATFTYYRNTFRDDAVRTPALWECHGMGSKISDLNTQWFQQLIDVTYMKIGWFLVELLMFSV